MKFAHSQSTQPYLDQPVGWISRLVLSNNDLSSGTQIMFRPEFNKTTGQGSLFANRINASAVVQSSSPWTNPDAGVLLKSQDPFLGRRIFTRNEDTKTGVPFVWDELSSAQKTGLGNAAVGPTVLAFLRGDTTNEGAAANKFRVRATPLGAIVHSRLVRWTDSTGQRLFVGANDGMLHAFDAANGRELFAYVPSMLIPRLKDLVDQNYKPQAFVDGPLVIAKVISGGAAKTLLVGGLGGGGQGLFALDVSSSSFGSDAEAAKALKWEISPNTPNFSNLGYTYAAPSLVRLENGEAAVVVGNGYGSASGKATLLVIDADSGNRISEIDTGVGSTGSPNGLSSPTVLDQDGDGQTDTAYAGDLQGNLWKFDLKAYTKTKLFTTSTPQAITTAPALRRHPGGVGQLVIFGTGQALIDDDLTDTSDHAVYGIWDGAPSTHQTLLEQSFEQVDHDGKRWRTTTTYPINWGNQAMPVANTPLHKGWKLSLPDGERLLGESPFIEKNRFVFTSMNPTISGGGGYGPGENWLMEVSVFNGGIDTPIFDVNGNGKVNKGDNVSGKVLNGRFIANGVVSQPVLTDSNGLSRTLFNYDPEITHSALGGEETSTQETYVGPSGGVSNGHFDVDIYYGGKNKKHTHNYDDQYNVVGVNFLAPSQADYKITNAIAGSTQFKILVVNQYLNPASLLRVGPEADYVNVKDFQGQASATDANFVTALNTFSPSSVGNFVWKLPLDAFKSQDWWGDTSPARAGLIPTQTGCVNKGYDSNLGPNGEIYNGALTLQLIRPETPATALELNYLNGGPKYGWRVKAGSRGQYLLAEYTLFWHHPNKICYDDAGWVPNPPQDSSSKATSKTPAAGSSDPVATSPGEGGSVTEVSRTVTVNGNVTITVITYSDGGIKTIKATKTGTPPSSQTLYLDGTKVDATGEGCNGVVGASCLGPDEKPFQDGRFNWRELRTND